MGIRKRRFAAAELTRLWAVIFKNDASINKEEILARISALNNGADTEKIKETQSFFEALRAKNTRTSLQGIYDDILKVVADELN